MENFSDMGFRDVVVGTELFRALNIYPKELSDPMNYSKIKEIAGFLNEHPDPMFVIGRLRNKKTTMSNIDYLASYVKLNKTKAELQGQIEKVDKDLKFYD